MTENKATGEGSTAYFEWIFDDIVLEYSKINDFEEILKWRVELIKPLLPVSYIRKTDEKGNYIYPFLLEGYSEYIGGAFCTELKWSTNIKFYQCNKRPGNYPEFDNNGNRVLDKEGNQIIYGWPAVAKYLHDDISNLVSKANLEQPKYPAVPIDFYGLQRVWPGKPENEKATKQASKRFRTPSIVPEYHLIRATQFKKLRNDFPNDTLQQLGDKMVPNISPRRMQESFVKLKWEWPPKVE